MNTYVALMRGINIGGRNKISMTLLKKHTQDAGFTDVETYINSGNLIFTSSEQDPLVVSEKIEKLIKRHFDLDVPVLIKSKEHIQKINQKVSSSWINDSDHQTTEVMFLWGEYANRDSKKLLEIVPNIDEVIYIDGSLVWHLEKKNYRKSGITRMAKTEIYKNMTVRNINTVRKINLLLNKIK